MLSVLAAGARLAGPATAANRPVQRLPDVLVTPVGVTFTKYAFKGEAASRIAFCERTFNFGKARTPRRLHNEMVLLGPGGIRAVIAKRDVPRLPAMRPGVRGGRDVYSSHRGCGRGENVPLDLPPGAYDVRICADTRLRDSDPSNNCRRFRKAFVVAKRSWSGAISGTGPALASDIESWLSSGAIFTFVRRDQYGRFVYDLTAGSVSYKHAQTIDTGCNRTGAGTDAGPGGQLLLDYVGAGYYALGRTSVGFSFPVLSLCSDDMTTGPANPLYLDTGIGAGAPRPLPFGSEQIAGTRTTDADARLDWIFR